MNFENFEEFKEEDYLGLDEKINKWQIIAKDSILL